MTPRPMVLLSVGTNDDGSFAYEVRVHPDATIEDQRRAHLAFTRHLVVAGADPEDLRVATNRAIRGDGLLSETVP